MNLQQTEQHLTQLLGRYSQRRSASAIPVNFRKMLAGECFTDSLTHTLHPYPAKLLMHIPYFFLHNTLLSQPGDNILDVFTGSGTVLLEAIAAGRNAYGADCNPLARFISTVKTKAVSPQKLNTEKEKLLVRILVQRDCLPAISFSSDNLYLWVAHSYFTDVPNRWDEVKMGTYCASEILKIEIQSQTIVDRIRLDNNKISVANFNQNRNRIALLYDDGQFEIWNLENGSCSQSVRHMCGDHCIKFIDDDTFLTDGDPRDNIENCGTGNVVLWSIHSKQPLRIFNKLHRGKLWSIGIINDKEGNKYVLSGGQDGKAILWELDTGKIVWSKRCGGCVGIATSRDGRKAVISGKGDPILITFDF
jgi:WD40 repeat protein